MGDSFLPGWNVCLSRQHHRLFITVKGADTDQKSINLLLCVSQEIIEAQIWRIFSTQSLETYSWEWGCSSRDSTRPPDPPTRWSARRIVSLMGGRVWGAVIRWVLHRPEGRNGRDDTDDLWIIYQCWRRSCRIKNVALAQMTFSSSPRPDCTMRRRSASAAPSWSGHVIKTPASELSLELI